jgi:hypothetical protein
MSAFSLNLFLPLHPNKGKGLLPIATPSVPYTMFADVDDILRSPLVHSLIYTVLYHSASSTDSSLYSGAHPSFSLHIAFGACC